MRILDYLHRFFQTRMLKTIWLNWKMLPARQAVRLPIFVFGQVRFRDLSGRFEIKADYVYPGMIRLGLEDAYVTTSKSLSIWTVRGTVIFTGRINFYHGSYVLVSDDAVLKLGTRDTFFGSNVRIMCFDTIEIGDTVRCSWDCQFIDTSFHYIRLLNKNSEVKPLTSPIIIGNRVWIGNRTTVSKGSVIPDNTIITSNSLVNKDFSSVPPYSMLAGSPAKLKGIGFERIFDHSEEAKLDKHFGYTRTHL